MRPFGKQLQQVVPLPGARRLGICLISEEFPPEMAGGIATYTYDLARGLAALGHCVHVISRTWGEPRTEIRDNLHIHRLHLAEPSWRWGTWHLNLQYPETRYTLQWAHRVHRELRRILDEGNIEIVECPEYHAQGFVVSLLELRVPLVVKLHTPAYLCRRLNGTGAGGSPTDIRLSELMEKLLTRRATRVTAPSESMAEEVSRSWDLRLSSIDVVPNPVDDELFSPGNPPGQASQTVLFVGRIERRKGVEVLVDAVAAVLRGCPNAKFRLIGSDHPSAPAGGSMVQYLQARLNEAGVPFGVVEFCGARERSALPDAYRAASVCVVPSFYESFGYTCTEPMSVGRAVIASDTGALSEIVTHEVDGLLVPPGDAGALAQSIIRLLRDASLCDRLGRAARCTIQHRFSIRAVSEQTARTYCSVVSQ